MGRKDKSISLSGEGTEMSGQQVLEQKKKKKRKKIILTVVIIFKLRTRIYNIRRFRLDRTIKSS